MFSVVIPLYNKALSIRNTVYSVLKQTFQEFEIVIVNDGSSDNSLEIVNRIEDSRIKIVNKINGGVSSARNTGVQNSKFEWIAFLDGDDLWEENHLEVLAEMVETFPNNYFFSTSFEYSDLRFFPRNYRSDRFTLISNYFKDVLTEHLVWTSCAMVHKEAFTKIGGFREDLSLGEDFDVWHKLVNHGFDLIKANDITAIYRVGAENRSDAKRYNLSRSFLLTLDLRSSNKYERRYYYINIWKKIKMFIVKKDIDNLFKLLIKVVKK